MRSASTYRCNRRRRDRGLPNSKLLKWERKKRGISRRQLDREREAERKAKHA